MEVGLQRTAAVGYRKLDVLRLDGFDYILLIELHGALYRTRFLGHNFATNVTHADMPTNTKPRLAWTS